MAAPTSMASRILRAGLLTGVMDGMFSSILSVAFYDSSATRLFQGVAGVLIGAQPAMDGGVPTALLGLLMHFAVAFAWSILFVMVCLRLAWLRNLIASKHGVLKVAALYGPFIWSFMSLVVIPLLIQRPPSITTRWWIQFFGHIPFVGLPIVAMAKQHPDRR